MKVLTGLCLATGVASFALPDWHAFEQLPITSEDADVSPWPALDAVISDAKKDINLLRDDIEDFVGNIFSLSDDDVDVDDDIGLDDLEARPPHQHNMTIYELISASKLATNFTALIDDYKDLVEVLNSTKTNSTLFVPINRAFRDIPDKGKDGKKPPKEFVEALLQYHVGDDAYFGRDLFRRHTIPTLLKEEMLGGEPQRLRVRVGFFSTHVNFYSKVIVANVGAKNGVVHFVNHILVPPPFAGRELALFPSTFSTLLLAYEKTDFVNKTVHRMKTTGGTVFAPSNAAFRRLGPAANAFLFNTPRGLQFLEALLKYQIVANVTLYSDAKYEAKSSGDVDVAEEAAAGQSVEVEHFELDTLLGKPLFVDIKKWHGVITSMTVNRRVGIKVQDGIAKNAVVHVVDKLPIPPHKHGKHGDGDGDEMSPEELEERLAPYLVDEDDTSLDFGEL